MYHHRADIRRIVQFPHCPVEHADILPGRGIAIAVCQKLPALAQGTAAACQKFFVGKRAVPGISIGRICIRRTHPGGARLGRTVQKSFITTQFEMGLVSVHMCGKFVQKPLAAAQVGIAYHIQVQCLRVTQGAVERRHHIGHHPFLYGGDAVGCICLLRFLKRLHQGFRCGHGRALQVFNKGVFLHIACQLAVFHLNGAARRGGRIRPHPKFLQCQRIEHPGMAGRMLQHKRVVRRGLVQKAFMRRALFLQRIVVVPAGHHPLPCRNCVFANELLNTRADILVTLCALQPHLKQRIGIAGKMAVRIQKGGQQRTAR